MKKIDFSKQFVDVFPDVLRGLMRRQSDALIKGQITAPQFLVLNLIFTRGPLRMSDLSALMQVSLPAATGLVDRLKKMNMVKRIFDQQDRRIVKISLTVKGGKIVQEFRKQRKAIFNEIFKRFPAHEKKMFLESLIKIKDILLKSKKGKCLCPSTKK